MKVVGPNCCYLSNKHRGFSTKKKKRVINIEKYVMICLLKILNHVLVVFRVCFDKLNDTIMTGKVIFCGCLKA